MQVLGTGAHVRGRQLGVGLVDHGAVRASSDVLELGLESELAVRVESRSDELHLGFDAGPGVDADQVVLHLDRAAVLLGAGLGELVHLAGHLVRLFAAEGAGSAEDSGLAGVALDLDRVVEGLDATGLHRGGQERELVDEVRGRVVRRPELATVHAGMRVHAPEGDGHHAADEAADVDRAQALAVHGPERVPAPHDVLGHDRDVEFADLLVHAEPERDLAVWAVGVRASEEHLHRRDERRHAGLVVGAEECRTVRGHDLLALEADEVRGRDDHASLREDDVAPVVGVHDGFRSSGELGVGVEVRGEDRVGRLLVAGALRELEQEGAVLELHERGVDADLPELGLDHGAEHQLSLGTGFLGLLALLAQDRLGVDLHVTNEPVEHFLFVIHGHSSP